VCQKSHLKYLWVGRQAVTHTHLQNSAVISDLRDVAGPFWICANLHQASSDLEEHQA